MAGRASGGAGVSAPGRAYHGRIAPSPTGFLHLGHARTFWVAHHRARRAGGRIGLRFDDIDGPRCRAEFVTAAMEDLRWLGLDWDGEPVFQSERYPLYRDAFLRLLAAGWVYPCYCSRRDIREAASAPHEGGDEIIYPGTCRDETGRSGIPALSWEEFLAEHHLPRNGRLPCWRFRVPDGEVVAFTDGRCGRQTFEAGRDFGDFVVWRQDGIVSYQLACVVDDAETGITEVVRGEDLLVSTARQLLLARALQALAPDWYHCPLLADETGQRLAKRSDAVSLQTLRRLNPDPCRWIDEWRAAFSG